MKIEHICLQYYYFLLFLKGQLLKYICCPYFLSLFRPSIIFMASVGVFKLKSHVHQIISQAMLISPGLEKVRELWNQVPIKFSNLTENLRIFNFLWIFKVFLKFSPIALYHVNSIIFGIYISKASFFISILHIRIWQNSNIYNA